MIPDNIVIFGGTGTLGNALAQIVADEGHYCWIVSRCELRQKEMAKKFPNFNYVIGDVTNSDWEEKLPNSVDNVFNLAAMKHVDLGESNVYTCVNINYFGTVNTFRWANKVRAKSYSLSSTDKAILPVNAYGHSKALAMKYIQERQSYLEMVGNIFLWGNVCASRGSVFKEIESSIASGQPVKLTDRRMSRFWLKIEDASSFMWEKRNVPCFDEPHIIPNIKAASLVRLIDTIADGRDYRIEEIGIRPGEKLSEVLRSGHDYCVRSDMPEYQMTDEELRTLVNKVLNR